MARVTAIPADGMTRRRLLLLLKKKSTRPLRRDDEVSACLPIELPPGYPSTWLTSATCRDLNCFITFRSTRPRLYRRRWHSAPGNYVYVTADLDVLFFTKKVLQLSPRQQSLQTFQPDPDTWSLYGTHRKRSGQNSSHPGVPL